MAEISFLNCLSFTSFLKNLCRVCKVLVLSRVMWPLPVCDLISKGITLTECAEISVLSWWYFSLFNLCVLNSKNCLQLICCFLRNSTGFILYSLIGFTSVVGLRMTISCPGLDASEVTFIKASPRTAFVELHEIWSDPLQVFPKDVSRGRSRCNPELAGRERCPLWHGWSSSTPLPSEVRDS